MGYYYERSKGTRTYELRNLESGITLTRATKKSLDQVKKRMVQEGYNKDDIVIEQEENY